MYWICILIWAVPALTFAASPDDSLVEVVKSKYKGTYSEIESVSDCKSSSQDDDAKFRG